MTVNSPMTSTELFVLGELSDAQKLINDAGGIINGVVEDAKKDADVYESVMGLLGHIINANREMASLRFVINVTGINR